MLENFNKIRNVLAAGAFAAGLSIPTKNVEAAIPPTHYEQIEEEYPNNRSQEILLDPLEFWGSILDSQNEIREEFPNAQEYIKNITEEVLLIENSDKRPETFSMDSSIKIQKLLNLNSKILLSLDNSKQKLDYINLTAFKNKLPESNFKDLSQIVDEIKINQELFKKVSEHIESFLKEINISEQIETNPDGTVII